MWLRSKWQSEAWLTGMAAVREYSDTNVKLIGISYGELGMSHHSAQDIAAMSAIPNMRVCLPSDRFRTARLIQNLLTDDKSAYVRVGCSPVGDI